jgi:hypothetical protein
VALAVVLLMLIPVYIAQRIAGGADVATRSRASDLETVP